MNRIGELYNKHLGEAIIIMGGAPSLPKDIYQRHADVYISCNHHAVQSYHADYIVAMDGAICGVNMGEFMAAYNAPLISPYKHFGKYHVDMTARPHLEHMVNTGILSIFVASQMGASSITCCGFDFYQGDEMYFNTDKWAVRDSNKKRPYFERCINRIKQLNVNVKFVNPKIDCLLR
jgi:hypothetical protein